MQKKQLISESTKKLLAHVNEHPGIRYRELLRLTGLSNGVLSFHLKKLKKAKLVQAKRLGHNVTRYYPKAVKANESDLLDHLLNSTRRRIIFFLLKHSNCKFKEVVRFIHRAPSTTLFQLQRLEHAGIISVSREGKKNQFYLLKNKVRIVRTASKYKIRL